MDKEKEVKEPDKGFNLKVYELETSIMNIITQSGLPAIVQNYIVQNVANKISFAARNIIDSERHFYIEECKEYGKKA